MKTPKYRAWDPWGKEMLKVHGINFDTEGVWTEEIFDDEDDGNFIYLCDVELMPWTGLKDRRGVEIYDGDILYWEDLSEKSDGTLNDKVKVFWDDGKMMWCVQTMKNPKAEADILNDYQDMRELEVIGNIWEGEY